MVGKLKLYNISISLLVPAVIWNVASELFSLDKYFKNNLYAYRDNREELAELQRWAAYSQNNN